MYSSVCLNTHAYSKMLQQGRQLLQMLKNCLYWTVEDDGGVTPILAFCPRFIFSSGLLLYFWTIDPVLSKVDNSSLDSCFTCQLKWVHQHISWKLSIPEFMNSSSINAISKEIFVYLFGTCTWKKYTTLSCGVKYQCDSRCGFVCVRRINRWLQMAQLLPPHSSTKVIQV